MMTFQFPDNTKLDDMKTMIVEQTLAENDGNKLRTAFLLGISVKTVYNILSRRERSSADRAHGVVVHEVVGLSPTVPTLIDEDSPF